MSLLQRHHLCLQSIPGLYCLFFFFSNKQFEDFSQSLDMFGVLLEVNLSSVYGENIHVSHSAENTVLGLIFTPVRSFCLNCTAAGSCHPVQPERPLSSSSVKWFDL